METHRPRLPKPGVGRAGARDAPPSLLSLCTSLHVLSGRVGGFTERLKHGRVEESRIGSRLLHCDVFN